MVARVFTFTKDSKASTNLIDLLTAYCFVKEKT